jgi:hypothetical protein
VFAPRETLLCIEQPDELGHIDLSVPDQPSQQAWLQVSVIWNVNARTACCPETTGRLGLTE